MSLSSGSPKSGKITVMESESPDPEQLHGSGTVDVPFGLQLLYKSMRTWYELHVAIKKPGKPKALPPVFMMFFPRLFEKCWGYDRLFPVDLNVRCFYHAYLKKFRKHNQRYATPEAYVQCLKKENKLRSLLLAKQTNTPKDDIILSDNILNCTLELILRERAGSSLAMIAASCIAKENELIIERLMLGPSALDPEEPPTQSTEIRQLALRYVEGCPCDSDVARLALEVSLLGITKESEFMVRNLRSGYDNDYLRYQSRGIRGFALKVVTEKLYAFTTASMDANKSADDYKVNMVAAVEADAEKYSWSYLAEDDPASEEESVIENSEMQQLEEVVHHMLPHGDNENTQEG